MSEAPANKRQKRSPEDDLICPISLELPWEPVTAEDGRVYERECIEEHIKKNPGNLKSPITNEKMGRRLLPAIWVHNHIDTLVESGAIEGDLAAKWNKKVEQKKKMEELLKKADGGDGDAMHSVGLRFLLGLGGFNQDTELAFQWHQRSHEAGNVKSTAVVGRSYLLGTGVQLCRQKGTMYVSIAAGQGSNVAAFDLGMALADGKYGFSVNKAEAIRWLEKAVGDCSHDHLRDSFKNRAQQKLNELKASVSEPEASSVTP
ncbi:Sel1 domain protein repeat-containing protein [Seminavis robusta]|uniref:Sel1 domain protein repeat-containing protein n=1 Tax=Seminavis robusta TaxID=568900 RepID=A0A9N8E415_9STRA|nr:Sel1 domain protein repeat-containing protein [Seminavis robusta]|eukprot:Sro639_g179810.1 Sel1 domain protein repeat-containing protein (260) ;mRNA; f:50059-50838